MTTTNKLSVREALDKLRSTDPPKSKRARLEEDLETLRGETRELQATRHRLTQHSTVGVDWTPRKG